MELLKNSQEISKALKNMIPNKIAVAFVGENYNDYIKVKYLSKIIICPKYGTNPHAVGTLVDELGGWEKVFFLDSLHTKIYIGKKKAVLGSANLSKNGLGDTSQEEIGVLIDDTKVLNKLNERFDELLTAAKDNYPSEKLKREKLEELFKITRRVRRLINEIDPPPPPPSITFDNYDPLIHGIFKVCWYESGAIEHNWNTLQTAFPAMDKEEIEKVVADEMEMARGDIADKDDWILSWLKRKSDDKCDQRLSIQWINVHKKVPGGSKEKDYPDLVIELKGEHRDPPPFQIEGDSKFKEAFCNVIDRDSFSAFRSERKQPWRTQDVLGEFDNFLKELKKEYSMIKV